MTTLIIILQWLALNGVSLKDFSIVTISPSDVVYECDGYVTPEATILVCYKEKLIRIVK